MDKLAVRASASHPSLGGCQLECLHARDFVCRAFSYRHAAPGAPPGVCLLSDRTLSELHPRDGLVPDIDFEIYERMLGGRGCQHVAPFPPSTPWGGAEGRPPPPNGIRDNDPLPPLLLKPIPSIQERPNNLNTGHTGQGMRFHH